jgi:branched-chain amino acid transport system ATP-binding protein
MLEIKGLTKDFGGLRAVGDVDLSIKPGEIVGLIGPNGAGKTTFFNLITGYIHPTKGKITFEGKDVTGKKPHSIARLGIVRTFQQSNIFSDLTVLQNLILACHLKPGVGTWETVLRTPGSRRKDKTILKRCQSILRMVELEGMADLPAKTLAHGHKRMLGIAIALSAEPKLLMLDEPLSGMNGEEVTETMALIEKLWQSGLTIFLIEHNMRAAMGLCRRIAVLNFGRKIAEGTPDEVKKNPDVIQAYLGANEYVTKTE